MGESGQQKLLDVLGELLSLPPQKRGERMGQLVLSEDDRRQLDQWLAREGKAEDFLKSPAELPDEPTADEAHAREDNRPRPVAARYQPERIGPYRILELIGEGGMGEVYRAEQTRPIRRTVAIKVIKLGMDSREVLARFEAERQALALMDHPNVARVLDAGTSESGRPYFVMEYVQGEPITDYCDRHRLTTDQRLELFCQACEGVHHAHQKAIIHRDLKPTNLLVTIHDQRTVVKIIDFGIAKALSQRLTERTFYTERGQLIGTPEYMSPEQAEMSGLDVDTRTDIYSLGVVLYELLTGAQPFESKTLRGAAFAEMARIIREEEPPKPSTRLNSLGPRAAEVAEHRRLDVRTLLKRLRGEIDWIILKAMEKDRVRRYPSASELAADIHRYLRQQPVLAGPPGAGYRLKKFLRRNRFAVAAAALVFLALTAAAVMTSVGLVRERALKRQAERETDKARAVVSFLTGLLKNADPTQVRGRDYTVRQALDAAEGQVDTQFQDQPDVRLALHQTLGQTYGKLMVYSKAEKHLRAAWELVRKLYGNDAVEAIPILGELGQVLQYKEMGGEFREASLVWEERYRIARKRLGDNDPVTLVARGDYAVLKGAMEPEGSPDVLLENISRLMNGKRTKDEVRRDIEGAMAVAEKQLVAGNQAEAVRIFRREADKYVGLSPEVPPYMATAVSNLSLRQFRLKLYDQAEVAARVARQYAREIHGPDHPITALVETHLAETLMSRPRPTEAGLREAEDLLRRAVAIGREVATEEHPQTLLMQLRLARVMRKRGRPQEALELAREIGRLAEKGEERRVLPAALCDEAEALLDLNRVGEATAAASRSRQILEELNYPEPFMREVIKDLFDRIRLATQGQAILAATRPAAAGAKSPTTAATAGQPYQPARSN